MATKAHHYYKDSTPVKIEDYPKYHNSKFLRRLYRKGDVKIHKDGKETIDFYPAQTPHIVTVPIMQSEFSIDPDFIEVFVIVPNGEPGKAGHQGLNLWKRWFRQQAGIPEDQEFPRVAAYDAGVGAVIGEQIEWDEWDETWKDVRTRSHKCVGDPRDPFGFTCTDPDFRIYRTGDPAEGLKVY